MINDETWMSVFQKKFTSQSGAASKVHHMLLQYTSAKLFLTATLWWCTSCCWWAHLELWGLICLCSDLNPQKWECCSEVPRQSMQFWVTGRSVMETQPSGYMSFLIKPESMVIWLVQTNLEGLWWLWRIRVWVLGSLKVWDDDVSSERKHYAAGWSLVSLSPEWTAEKASQEVMCWTLCFRVN